MVAAVQHEGDQGLLAVVVGDFKSVRGPTHLADVTATLLMPVQSITCSGTTADHGRA